MADGKIRWNYRDSKTGRPASLLLDALDFMGRFLQHILPRGYARVRTFGWWHPAAKVRANRVRALLRQQPLLTAAEQQVWDPPADPGQELPVAQPPVACAALLCPRCHKPMRLVAVWRPGQVLLYPKRPP